MPFCSSEEPWAALIDGNATWCHYNQNLSRRQGKKDAALWIGHTIQRQKLREFVEMKNSKQYCMCYGYF